MRRLSAVLVLVFGLVAPAQAVTLRDLIDLSKQGLSDDLLIALVEAERSVFHLSASDLKALKDAGFSDRLVIHLLQTPSLRPAPEPSLLFADEPSSSAPAPDVVVIERVELIAVPVYLPVRSRHARRDRPAPPVYWGYGGTRRPDAWR